MRSVLKAHLPGKLLVWNSTYRKITCEGSLTGKLLLVCFVLLCGSVLSIGKISIAPMEEWMPLAIHLSDQRAEGRQL